ncbi:unnamed protein product, partial [marine sediment metagenome]
MKLIASSLVNTPGVVPIFLTADAPIALASLSASVKLQLFIKPKIITGQTEPEEQAKQLLKYSPEITVIITMGGNGSLVRTKDRIIRASSYKIEV